jgi:hypothetical protein
VKEREGERECMCVCDNSTLSLTHFLLLLLLLLPGVEFILGVCMARDFIKASIVLLQISTETEMKPNIFNPPLQNNNSSLEGQIHRCIILIYCLWWLVRAGNT